MESVSAVIKLRLYPDDKTARILDSQSRKCNWLYNHLVETANGLRDKYITTQDKDVGKKLYSDRGLRNLVPTIKAHNPFLKTVYAAPLKNAALRLTAVIKSYQRNKKSEHRTGWPKFKSWKANWFSLLYDEPDTGYRIKDNTLELSLGLGVERKRCALKIPIAEAELLAGNPIRNLRIVKECNVFFAVFTVHRAVPEAKEVRKIIALDPNHKNLAYGVDTDGIAVEIAAPHWLKKHDKRQDELKAKRDRCKKRMTKKEVLDDDGNATGSSYFEPSRRWKKYDVVLQKALAKRREQTKTFCYTLANQLYKTYDKVVIGDYTPHGNGITSAMRRSMNNRSLIGRLKSTLSWVGMKTGKSYAEYDEKGTTRTCHACGHSVEGGVHPSVRSWICQYCNTWHIRDENAAINGLQRELKQGDGQVPSSVPSSGLVPVKQRWAWCVLPSGVAQTPQGQYRGSTTSTRKFKLLTQFDTADNFVAV